MKKQIKCYYCEKKGTAVFKEAKRKNKWTKTKPKKIWQAKGFKNGLNWICTKCNTNRCKNCEIILSNTRTCGRHKMKYGAYREGNKYCKLCAKQIREEANKLRKG
jgi:hypothetical protein